MDKSIRRRGWSISLLAASCLGASCWGIALVAQEPPASVAARSLIASQVASEFGVWQRASEGRVSSEDIRVLMGPSVAPGVLVFRGVPSRDHWHPYLVVVRGDTLCGAGGFTTPELPRIASWLRDSYWPQGPEALARVLASLADENGTVEAFLAGEAAAPGQREVAGSWSRLRPQNWPRDTSLMLPTGRIVVRLTLLSQRTRSYDLSWTATAYDFQFQSDGRLVAWSRRQSQPFAVTRSR